MESIPITRVRNDIYNIVSLVSNNHIPVEIKGKDSCAVLISKEDWNSIQETLYLQSIPGMTKSILETKYAPIEEMIDAGDVDW